MSRSLFAGLALLTLGLVAVAVPPVDPKQPKPKPDPKADPSVAASRAVIEGGLKATVWASEPLMENPVVFSFNRKGVCYVVETNRMNAGVPDTRSFMYWLDDDIAARSVEDRLAMYQKQYPGKKKYDGFEKNSEIVRKLWDSTGSGFADQSSIFSDGYNKPADGVAAGVLAKGNDVYFACIPSLYKLKDTKGENKADVKEVLSTGYGVHAQFVGHDLHGLKMGPDGRLYFSIGDRGFKVTTKEGKLLHLPDCGAVLRCELDGSHLEIVHTGLRNPQEIAFDDVGNLFTYDNNSDSGDQARWVQIIEGGDSGWRCGYQYGTLMHHPGVPQGNRGPWNTEKIWHVPGPNGAPPAYVVPPLRHFGNGPSGLTYYPGVGLNDRYKGHFFACDFTASPSNSVVWSLACKPKGASFEVVDLHGFVKNMVPTDCDFGPDGAFYWSDWIGGWDLPRKGRMFRVEDPEAMKNPAIAEAKQLFAEGLAKSSIKDLIGYLGHAHKDVRQDAQFELAARAKGVEDGEVGQALVAAARDQSNGTRRRHALWAMGQIRREAKGKPFFPIEEFAGDADAEIRMQAVKLGAGRARTLALLKDADPAIRREAAIAYGKFKPQGSEDYRPLLTFLKDNNNADVYLRHAAVQGMTAMTEQPCDLTTAFDYAVELDKSLDTPAVRLGVVLSLRKLQCRRISRFLADSDPTVVAETARAIYDQELMSPMAELAALADKSGLTEPVAYRALAANYKLGEAEGAARLANFAARTSEPDYLRIFALKLLMDWAAPSRRDVITGLTQSLPARDAKPAAEGVKAQLVKLLTASDAVRSAAVQAVAKLKVEGVNSLLVQTVIDTKQPVNNRVEGLFALELLKASELKQATDAALASSETKLRAAGRVVAAKANPDAARKELPALINSAEASVYEKQMAFGVLGSLPPSEEIDELLSQWLDKLIAGTVPAELKLDLIEAADARVNTNRKLFAPLKDKLTKYDRQARDNVKTDPLSRFRDALAGGDADKGKEIFLNNSAVYCQRCHKLNAQGGEVGPDLSHIAKDKTRDYLLESIVDPNKQIAKGFESVILSLADGRTVSGVLRSKTDKEYTIVDAEGKVTKVARDDVEREKPDKSAMPDDLYKKLSRRELRDVVEFLSQSK
ncbi:MAG: c-type cytochrome [Gemmataceae bacterium]